MAKWQVLLGESAIEDLRSLGQPSARKILDEASRLLAADPRSETRNSKTLRPNAVAERELRLFGKYRVLFNVDVARREATIVLVGEKQGSALIVRGRRFTAHEDHLAE
jgi:mRNA-degrading endonuclease RelE of RelBE toxin-antitoxin system